ncbi:MAG: hypothetical protein WCL54_00935 [Clostridia bacterium]
MPIDFSPARWDKTLKNYDAWWDGTLERPLVPVILTGKDAGRPEPSTPYLSQSTCHDLSISAEDLIDRIDHNLSTFEFLGDAFPTYGLSSFGPGLVAAFLGARLDNSTGGVWFHPTKEIEDLPIADLHFEYDENNVWLNRIKDICRAGMKRWQGQVNITMPDMGGTLDVLSSFRPGEKLLLDLYDEPEDVKRLTWEIHDLWHRFYNEINDVLKPYNPGYCDWSQILSSTPSYVLQSDFSYMIGPEMFAEFTLPELTASSKRLSRSMYHLDGVGQLPHLDQVLAIPSLGAVQWVPGDGMPEQFAWPEVQARIAQAHKNTQVWCGIDRIADVIAQRGGAAGGIQHTPIWDEIKNKAEFQRKLASFGIE